MRRRAGSVRFDPYYKLQVWREDVGGAWVDLQKALVSEEAAREEADTMLVSGTRFRIMRIEPGGRAPVYEGRAGKGL